MKDMSWGSSGLVLGKCQFPRSRDKRELRMSRLIPRSLSSRYQLTGLSPYKSEQRFKRVMILVLSSFPALILSCMANSESFWDLNFSWLNPLLGRLCLSSTIRYPIISALEVMNVLVLHDDTIQYSWSLRHDWSLKFNIRKGRKISSRILDARGQSI